MGNDRLFDCMKYKARGDGSLQGRPRVFFCCAAADFKRLFEPVTEEILSIKRNAVIWYVDPEESTMEGKTFLEDLSQVQLLVVPVTTAFLRQDKPDPARTVAFAYAVENGIPVLPLMQEPGLEQIFNEVCGNLMVLDKTAQQQGTTAAPYEEKLRRFLEGLLVSDELTKRVKDAFDAFIFLSYRKKDRASAQKIMRILHENEFCRDVAVWYDEFLNPGEDFNDAIFEMIEKSALYTLVVTDRLLETPNYVQSTEYQEALRQNKPILPLEDRATARDQLKRLYEKIPECIKTEDHTKIAEILNEILRNAKDVTLRENNTPEHTFLIGIAYLSGLFVEVDHERGVKLITEAAEAGLPEALEKLVTMYQTGEGVERNYNTAIEWREKMVEYCRIRVKNSPTENHYEKLFTTLCKLGDEQKNSGAIAEAKKTYEIANRISRIMVEYGYDSGYRNVMISCSNLGIACSSLSKHEEALLWHQRSLDVHQTRCPDEPAWLRMPTFINLGDVCSELGRIEESVTWYKEALKASDTLPQNDISGLDYRRLVSPCYERIGKANMMLFRPEAALEWYKRSQELNKASMEERGEKEEQEHLIRSDIYVGNALIALGRPKEALEWYQEALEKTKTLSTAVPSAYSCRLFSDCWKSISNIYVELSRPEEALLWTMKSVWTMKRLSKKMKTASIDLDYAWELYSCGNLSRMLQASEEALKWFQKSRNVFERLRKSHCTISARQGIGKSCIGIGDAIIQSTIEYEEDLILDLESILDCAQAQKRKDDKQKTQEALTWYHLALNEFEELEKETDTVESRQDLAFCLDRIGLAKEYLGFDDEALGWHQMSAEIRKMIVDKNRTIGTKEDYAIGYYSLGTSFGLQILKRIDYLERALSLFEELYQKTGLERHRKYLEDTRNELDQLIEVNQSLP